MKFLSNILVKAGLVVEGSTQLNSLAGVGTRMVVTNAAGVVSTQAIPVSSVTSVFGRTGAVTAQAGDYTTAQVAESGNLYYTDARARAAISVSATGLTYSAGVISLAAGYSIPTNASQANWDAAYAARITTANAPLSIAGNAISIGQANASTNGFLSSTDWNTFNNKLTGTSVAGRVAFYSGTNALTGSSELVFDPVNNRLGVSTAVPLAKVHITAEGTVGSTQPLLVQDNANVNLFYINDIGHIFVGSDGQSKQAKFFIHGIATSPFIDARSTGVTISSASNNDLVLNGNPIKFSSGATEIGRWFSTGNLRIQTGGVFADDLFKVDVQGTVRVTGNLTTNVTSALLKTNASGVLTAAIAGTDYQTPITNPVTGTAAAGQVTYWTGASAVSGSNNLFWDNTNGRLGIGTNAPAYRLHNVGTSGFDNGNSGDAVTILNNGFLRWTDVRFRGFSSSFQFQDNAYNSKISFSMSGSLSAFNTGGNYSFGTSSDLGVHLGVVGDTLLRGSGATNATTALTVQNSDSTAIFRVRNDGYSISRGGIFYGSATNNLITTSNSTNAIDVAGLNFSILFGSFDTAGFGVAIGGYNASTRTATSGASGTLNVSHGFAPTSGNGTYTMIQAVGTINQTGGANGITRGLYVNPTLTSAADWRSIEWSNNAPPVGSNSWGLYGTGTAPNYINGSLLIGSATNDTVNKLQVTGTVVAGSRTSTEGSVILRGFYTSGYLTTFGTDASSGGPMISYAVESAQNSTEGAFVSSTANVATPRSAYTVSSSHRWFTAAASTTAVGTSIALTKRMELYNSGNLVLGGASDVAGNMLQVNGNSLFTGTISSGAITATSVQGNGIVRSDASRTAAINDVSIALLGSNITTYAAGFSMNAAGYGLNAIYAQHEQRFGGNAQFSSANLVGGGLILNKLAPTAAGTVTMEQIPATGTVTNIRTMSNLHLMTQFSGNNNLTVTHMSGLHIYGQYRTSGTGVITVSGAYYGVLLADPNEFGAGATITGNNYGFYQQGTAPFNHFGGKVIIGTTATDGTSKLRISGLPTSAAGLLAGEVWNNGGVLTIV